MPKQYTFKTTRATDWLEEHLDSLPPSERSRFIRSAISDKLTKDDNIRQDNTLSYQKVTQKETKVDFPTLQTSPPPMEEGIIEEDVESLESKLDSIY